MWIYSLSKIQTLNIDTNVWGPLRADENSAAWRALPLLPSALLELPLQGLAFSAAPPPGPLPLTMPCPKPPKSSTPHTAGNNCCLHSPFLAEAQSGSHHCASLLYLRPPRTFSLPYSRAFPQLHSPGPQAYLKLNWTLFKFTPALSSPTSCWGFLFTFHHFSSSSCPLDVHTSQCSMLVPLFFSLPHIPSFLRFPWPPLCWRLSIWSCEPSCPPRSSPQKKCELGIFAWAVSPDLDHYALCQTPTVHPTWLAVVWTSGQRPVTPRVLTGTPLEMHSANILWDQRAGCGSWSFSTFPLQPAWVTVRFPWKTSVMWLPSSTFSVTHPRSGLHYKIIKQSLDHPII